MLIYDTHSNFRHQFYDVIRKQHVLVVSAADPDAVCATAIICQLFACDDVSYSLVTVERGDQLSDTLRDHTASSVLLVNCGGLARLVEHQLPDSTVVFVLDSHRPVNLDNVFDASVVRVLAPHEERDLWQLPDVSDLYAAEDGGDENDENDAESSGLNEEEGEDDNDDDGGDDRDEDSESAGFPRSKKRSRLERIEERLKKRTERAAWERNRQQLMWRYYESSWTGTSSSVLALELAHSLGRATSHTLWMASIGLCSQLSDQLVSSEYYTSTCITRMRPFIQRFAGRRKAEDAKRMDDEMLITFDTDLPLAFYTYWPLGGCMLADSHFACKTKRWTQRGDAAHRVLLSQLGLTLRECGQLFTSLSRDRRKEVRAILSKELESSFATFSMHMGYNARMSAMDVARALSVKLEMDVCGETSPSERWTAARSLLASCSTGTMNSASRIYRHCIEQFVWESVTSALQQSHLLRVGAFFVYAAPRAPDVRLTGSPHLLRLLMHNLQRAFASSRRDRARRTRPLLVSLPLHDQPDCLLVSGVMPLDTLHDNSIVKSFIGRAFQEAATASRTHIEHCFFDSQFVLISITDRSKFFDALQGVLTLGD